jgi:DNA helicase II / ATP-dependent DNA helicase PcrA
VGVTRAMRLLYLAHARRRAVFGAQTYGLRSRFLDELPAELTDQQEEPLFVRAGARDGVGASGAYPSAVSWASGGARAGGPSTPRPRGHAAAGSHRGAAGVAFRLGEDVEHAAFGEGVITGLEPDGVIVVRFARDGSERKLMAEFAPVSRR